MNFETITLGQIGLAVTFLVSLISGIAFLRKSLKKWIGSTMTEQMDTLGKKIDTIHDRVEEVDQQATKNFLVRILSDVERGKELDEIEEERLWEEYEHYTSHGGNSYIKRKVEKLKQEGKL